MSDSLKLNAKKANFDFKVIYHRFLQFMGSLNFYEISFTHQSQIYTLGIQDFWLFNFFRTKYHRL